MSYVYLIQSNEFFKIGITYDVSSRLSQLQTGNPNALVVKSCYEFSNAQAVEAVLHQKFASVRKHGEWFRLADKDIQDFGEICTMLGGVYFSPDTLVSSSKDTENAEEESSPWVELVKVKKWYYMRLMQWDTTSGKKVYVKHLGTLDDCKNNPEYSKDAFRLEEIRNKCGIPE